MRADKIAQDLPPQAWRRLSAGIGAKGARLYDWALTPLWRLQLSVEERRFGHYLLVRRSLDENREHAYFVVYAPRSKVTRQLWSTSLVGDGRSKSALRPPRVNAASTNMRCVAGRAGTATSRWCCWRTRYLLA